MFIIKCERDNSFCKVEDSEVIFVEDSPPKENDIVTFTYGGKEEIGEVIMISDNTKKINIKFEEIKKSFKKRLPSSLSPEEKGDKSSVPSKRSRRLNSKYKTPSFENLNLSKISKANKTEKQELKVDNKKKSDEIRQSQIEKEISHKPGKSIKPKDRERSPTKDELKKQLSTLEEQIVKSKKSANDQLDGKIALFNKNKNYVAVEDSATDSELDESTLKAGSSDWRDSSESNQEGSLQEFKISKVNNINDYDKENHSPNTTIFDNKSILNNVTDEHATGDSVDPDLYGKDWQGETMVKLMDKIYCKETEYKSCKCLSSQASHVVRRLITGVFKPSGYLDATVTGQAPRAHRQEGKSAPVKALNATAKNEIIDFAMALATAKKWITPKGVPQTKEQLASAMSQRIGELKRQHILANKQATS